MGVEVENLKIKILEPAFSLATCAKKHGLDRVYMKPWIADKIRAAMWPNVYNDIKMTDEGIEHFLCKDVKFIYKY